MRKAPDIAHVLKFHHQTFPTKKDDCFSRHPFMNINIEKIILSKQILVFAGFELFHFAFQIIYHAD
jgi:hypothetical protein